MTGRFHFIGGIGGITANIARNLFVANSHRITNIANIAIQILAYTQKDRKCHLFISPKLCHRTCGNIKVFPQRSRRDFFFNKHYPQLFIAYPQTTHLLGIYRVYSNDLVLLLVLLYNLVSITSIMLMNIVIIVRKFLRFFRYNLSTYQFINLLIKRDLYEYSAPN